MNTILGSIASTTARLAALAEVIKNEPAFDYWHPAGFADPGLVQLFPNSETTAIAARQEQAKAIARAFGGEWKRDVSDGSWRNEGGLFRAVLHRVDKMGRDEVKIDLTVPLDEGQETEDPRAGLAGNITEDEDIHPEHFRDEPDYDAPKALTPMENMLQNDEHHLR